MKKTFTKYKQMHEFVNICIVKFSKNKTFEKFAKKKKKNI